MIGMKVDLNSRCSVVKKCLWTRQTSLPEEIFFFIRQQFFLQFGKVYW